MVVIVKEEVREEGSAVVTGVIRAGRRWVWFSSTTILDDLSRADNVLKHDI